MLPEYFRLTLYNWTINWEYLSSCNRQVRSHDSAKFSRRQSGTKLIAWSDDRLEKKLEQPRCTLSQDILTSVSRSLYFFVLFYAYSIGH
jgi:hypothetical protein